MFGIGFGGVYSLFAALRTSRPEPDDRGAFLDLRVAKHHHVLKALNYILSRIGSCMNSAVPASQVLVSPYMPRFRRSKRTLFSFFAQLVKAARAQDMLGIDEDELGQNILEMLIYREIKDGGATLSDGELFEELFNVFGGAYETSDATLQCSSSSFAFYAGFKNEYRVGQNYVPTSRSTAYTTRHAHEKSSAAERAATNSPRP